MSLKQRLFLLFFLSVSGTFFALGLHEYIFIRPQSIHQWRQTVGLNITLNFAKQDNSFLQPEINLLNADNRTTGIAQGEFPILYYVVGKVWKYTGQQEWMFRLLIFGIFVTALWLLAIFIFEQTNNTFYSIVIPLFFLSLPVLAYYSVSFLMDSIGFSLVIIGWFTFYRYANTQKSIWFLSMLLAFLFTGLLKITSLITVFSLAFYCLLGIVFKWDQLKNESKWQKPVLIGIGLVTIIQVLWYAWAINYNNVHHGWYTQNGYYPIWEMTSERWGKIVEWVTSYWYYQYAPKLVYLLFFAMLAFLGIKRIKLQWARFFYVILLFSALGSALYLTLWFQVFHQHDYYIIAIYGFVLVATLGSLIYTVNGVFSKKQAVAFKIILTGVLLISIIQSSIQIDTRLTGWPNGNGTNKFASFFEIENYLRSDLGLSRTDKVITYADNSVCISLYLCDQKGWQMSKNSNVDFIKEHKKIGAKYLLINDSSFYQIEGIEELNLKKIGQHETITVFKIPMD